MPRSGQLAGVLLACLLFACDDDPRLPLPAPTATPSPAPTVAPLGKRRFEIDSAASPVLLALTSETVLRLGNFRGQSNGASETGFVELEGDAPDPHTGIARVAVTDASDYLYAALPAVGGIVFCVQIDTPVVHAGAIDCDGGSDFSVHLHIDHRVGELGLDDFAVSDCVAAGGSIEGAGRLCEAGLELNECRDDSDCDTAMGSADGRCGLADLTCTAPPRKVGDACRKDSDCDRRADATNGRCGARLPHLGVCNGPLTYLPGNGDSGAGALAFAPREDLGLVGLPGRFIIEDALPCGDEGTGSPMTFALTSALARGSIEDISNAPAQVVDFSMPQAAGAIAGERELQNLSCSDWSNPRGGGCLGLVAPVLDMNPATTGDLVPAFKFCNVRSSAD